ncbi:hypothetical protein [Flexithrix dorotheae]|uniref:hypothetical protein n=1 Tax=Flexithrix dorotheae TaxID=70993 RepID=UPI00037834B1|nr:hypothetical protein [Flexithrix dorotheae]
MNKILTKDVFTPSSPAKLNYVFRKEVNDQLFDALYTSGKQVVVFGYSGSGKTTLVRNKLDQIYSCYIYSQCIKETSLNSLLLDAFDQLNPFYISEQGNKVTIKITDEIGVKFQNISLALKNENIKENSLKKVRLLPPQLTVQNLAKFIGNIKACWVIDDFHKVRPEEKQKIAQVMKLFKDVSFDYPDTKIITIGAVESAKEIVNYDKELEERLEQIHVPLLSNTELNNIIEKGAKLLNLNFTPTIKNKIISLSNNLGAVCHQLCLNMCLPRGIFQTRDNSFRFENEDLHYTIERYIKSKSGSLSDLFDKITMTKRTRSYENNKIILKAIIDLNLESVSHSEILAKIKESHPSYPQGNLTTYLKKLSNFGIDEEVLYFNNSTNKYSIRNPFFKVFAAMRFHQETSMGNNTFNINVNTGDISIKGNIHIDHADRIKFDIDSIE